MAGPEYSIEIYLVSQLRFYGFRCDKGKIPGKAGFPDRWVFEPKWSPGPPSVVEVKAPGKKPRKLQLAEMKDLKERGVVVHDFIDSKEKVDKLVNKLLHDAFYRLSTFERLGLPKYIIERVRGYEQHTRM